MSTASHDEWHLWNRNWESAFRHESTQCLLKADAGHGIDHIERVVINAIRIGMKEGAEPSIVLPAAWLHDCVSVPKNSPDRHLASRLAADRAMQILASLAYPGDRYPLVHHAILAHSFSAKIACESIEARVVQDADRLEALGAIGMARCFMTGGAMSTNLYHTDQPFPLDRPLDDRNYSIDHFFAKLFRLPQTMQTESGRSEAIRRTESMLQFLEELCIELNLPIESLQQAHRTAVSF